MRFKILVVLAVTASKTFARYLPDLPLMTPRPQIIARQATPTSTLAGRIARATDPSGRKTENITQYFLSVPTTTGAVEEAINSFGGKAGEECLENPDAS
jgi:hypothetical protein